MVTGESDRKSQWHTFILSGNKCDHSIQMTKITYKWPAGKQTSVLSVLVVLWLPVLFLKPCLLVCQLDCTSISHFPFSFLLVLICVCASCPRLNLSYASLYLFVLRVLAATLCMLSYFLPFVSVCFVFVHLSDFCLDFYDSVLYFCFSRVFFLVFFGTL